MEGNEGARRPMGYWDQFNSWWRAYVDKHGRRPSVQDMRSWYDDNAMAIWGANGPSWDEAKKHSKGMRRLQDIPSYFRNYRRGRKKRAGGAADDEYISDSDPETHDTEAAQLQRKRKQPRSRANSGKQQDAVTEDGEQDAQVRPKPLMRPRAVSAAEATMASAAANLTAASGVTLFGVAIPFLGAWRPRSASTPVIVGRLDAGGSLVQLGHLGQAAGNSSSWASQAPIYIGGNLGAGIAGFGHALLPTQLPTVAVAGPTKPEQRALRPSSGSAEEERPSTGLAPLPLQLPAHQQQLQQDLRHPQDQQASFTEQLGVCDPCFSGARAQPVYEEQLGPFSTLQQQQLLLLQQEDLLPRPKQELPEGTGLVGAMGDILMKPGSGSGSGSGGASGLGVAADARTSWHRAASNGGTSGGYRDVDGAAAGSVPFAAGGVDVNGAAGGGAASAIAGLDSMMLMQVPSSALPPDMRVNEQRGGMLGRLFPRNSTLKMVHSLFNRWSVQQDAAEAEAAADAAISAAAAAASTVDVPVVAAPAAVGRAAAGGAAPGAMAGGGLMASSAAPHPVAAYGPPVVTTGVGPLQPYAGGSPPRNAAQPWQQQRDSPTGQWASSSPGLLAAQPPSRPAGALPNSGGSGGQPPVHVDAVGYITMPTPQAPCHQPGYVRSMTGPASHDGEGEGDIPGYMTPAGGAALDKRRRDDDSPASAITGTGASTGEGLGLGRTTSSRMLQRGLSGVLRPLLSWMSLGRRGGGAADFAGPDATAPTHGTGAGAVADVAAGATHGVTARAGGRGVGLGLALDLPVGLPSTGAGMAGSLGLLSGLHDSRLLDGLPSLADDVTERELAQMEAEVVRIIGAGGAAGRASGGGAAQGGGGAFRSGGDGAEREFAAAAEARGAVVVMAATAHTGGGGGEDGRAFEVARWPDVAASRCDEQAIMACVAADAELPTPFVVPEMQHRVSACTHDVMQLRLGNEPYADERFGADRSEGACGMGAGGGAPPPASADPRRGIAEVRTQRYSAGRTTDVDMLCSPQRGGSAAAWQQQHHHQQQQDARSQEPVARLPSRAGSEALGSSLLQRLSTSLSDYFRFLAR